MKINAIYSSLKNKNVLVTGGASGIGESIVESFLSQEANVAFIDKEFHYLEAHSIKKIADMMHVKKTDLIKLKAEMGDLLE